MKLEDHYDTIMKRVGLTDTDGFREDLIARYRGPDRWYHNACHIVSVIERIYDMCEPYMWQNRDIALVAALYHDAVYVPGWAANEQMSAALMENHLLTMRANESFIEDVSRAILATKTHTTGTFVPSRLLIDADLYELATDKCEYNGRRIRKEFAHVPDDIFLAGRKKFLHTYLLRDPFYYLSGKELEAAARQNMENELARLISGDGASKVHRPDPAEG